MVPENWEKKEKNVGFEPRAFGAVIAAGPTMAAVMVTHNYTVTAVNGRVRGYCPMTLPTNESSSSSSLIPTNWSTTSPPRMAITVGTADTCERMFMC
ncbi:hypothetical protein EYF80_031947 [Liparis tanakae]|uniref:Uncharacterized protein n=1 Tax=Liparis tanakae TaxID=230148 RepID=A0A4Z2GXN2_9TELE|nr:hypothetical protein EYF80_031947 [Liparis tanakae]